MKKNLFFPPVIFLPFILAIILFSCSKDKPALIPSGRELTANVDAERIGNWGSITGIILPHNAVVKIVLYNSYFSIADFYYTDDGNFRVDNISPGIYTVIIIDSNTSIEYTISGVKVRARSLSNIGVVKLQ